VGELAPLGFVGVAAAVGDVTFVNTAFAAKISGNVLLGYDVIDLSSKVAVVVEVVEVMNRVQEYRLHLSRKDAVVLRCSKVRLIESCESIVKYMAEKKYVRSCHPDYRLS